MATNQIRTTARLIAAQENARNDEESRNTTCKTSYGPLTKTEPGFVPFQDHYYM